MRLPYLKVAGALALIWIGVRLLADSQDEGEVTAVPSLSAAIRTILFADLVMSVDNVVAVVGAADAAPENYRVPLLVVGLAMSIPLVIAGSTLLARVMERYPIIVGLGAVLLGFLAGQMLVTDVATRAWFAAHVPHAALVAGAGGAALVVGRRPVAAPARPAAEGGLNRGTIRCAERSAPFTFVPMMTLEFHCASDTGRARNNNEDSAVVDEASALVVLADGMGGYNAGEVASGMCTSFIKTELGRWLSEASESATDTDVRRAMDICVDNANRAIFNAANSNPQYAGMGTTLVVGVFRENRLLLGHVGDSRCYRLRSGRLAQITHDHSLLQEQIDSGLITAEQAAFSANKNLVTRAVGVEDTVLLETHLHDVLPGDVYLLCSDGLSDMLDDETIGQLLQSCELLPEAASALIGAANEAGGKDNISVVLVRVRGPAGAARSWWPFRR